MSDHVQDPFEGADDQESKLNMDDFQDAFQLASKGQRFVNYLIDGLLIGIPVNLLFAPKIEIDPNYPGQVDTSGYGTYYFLLIVIMLAYYAVMEKNLGKTVGKMVTNTRVVREDGGAISWGQAFGRAASRFIPFEPFSVLFGKDGVGWHDKFPATRVVKNK